jgi:regulator of RNase E activity RraA
MNANAPSPEQLEQLRLFSTCVIASTIETFQVRLRNDGFTNSSLHCVFNQLPPMVGYAATARIRSADPPMQGPNYYDRRDWWASLLRIPEPRIVVIEDVDSPPGLGAFIGEVHANVVHALGCVGVVTNGAVRDVNEVRQTGLQVFAGNLSVSHAYAHIFDFGGTVEVAGLAIRPGDLLHGDLHGVLTIPEEIAGKVGERALEIVNKRKSLVANCKLQKFSMEAFSQKVKELKS